MLPEIGFGALVLAFTAAVYSVFAALLGERHQRADLVESARRSQLLTWPLLTISAVSLIGLLVNNRFDVSFVYEVTSRSMPTYLKITAWWGGQAGSLVFWAWLMAAFASLVTLRKWDRDAEFLPWVIVVTSTTLAFFLGLVIFAENPFARYWQTMSGDVVERMFRPAGTLPFVPQDGRGLNPLLRHPGMIVHPPLLYLGFVSFVIPYAFAMATLITGRTDDRWIHITRRWTLWAWLFLSLGLVFGARWAYDVLGWGGYWGWDPVEIAAFMPWLSGTAFLHSVMIQEKRGMLKQWNMLLIILTYDLVIFGTFLTRSGVLSSVHAFAQSAIGPAFFGFIGLTFVASVALLLYRWNALRAEAEMKSMLSREALFLLNNLLFLSVLIVCFWGVIFPLLSELVTGQKVTVGPPFYERATAPLFAAIMALMALAPLSAWGKSTWKTLGRAIWKPGLLALLITLGLWFGGMRNLVAIIGFFLVALVTLVTLYEIWRAARARQKSQKEPFLIALGRLFARNRRRYGGYLVHISMMMMALGILGIELFQSETQATLRVGESINLSGYQVRYDEIARFPAPDGREVTRAVVSVYRDGKYLAELHPRIDFYFDAQQTMTIPGQYSTLADDLYVLLVDWQPVSAEQATFKVYHNPLVNWLWLGALVFIAAILIAAWPQPEMEVLPVRAADRSPLRVGASD
jgi:cytochrome c-type biogenesis protein CcmF